MIWLVSCGSTLKKSIVHNASEDFSMFSKVLSVRQVSLYNMLNIVSHIQNPTFGSCYEKCIIHLFTNLPFINYSSLHVLRIQANIMSY